MGFLALIIAPWTKDMQAHGAIPRALADDLTTISIGKEAIDSTIAAPRGTFGYLNAFGGKVGVCKQSALASDKPARDQFSTITFPG